MSFRFDALYGFGIKPPSSVVMLDSLFSDREPMWSGVPIRKSELAVTTSWRIERNPLRKRRKRYRVIKHRGPGVFMAGGVCYVHPGLWQHFIAAISKEPGNGTT